MTTAGLGKCCLLDVHVCNCQMAIADNNTNRVMTGLWMSRIEIRRLLYQEIKADE